MSDEQINRKLAEWLGLKFDAIGENCYDTDGFLIPHNFTSSVDAIQPVLDKLIEMGCDIRVGYNQEQACWWCVIEGCEQVAISETIPDSPTMSRALALACYEAIEKMEDK